MKLVTLADLKVGDTFRYQNSAEDDWHKVSKVDDERLYYPGYLPDLPEKNYRVDNVSVILKEAEPEPEENRLDSTGVDFHRIGLDDTGLDLSQHENLY